MATNDQTRYLDLAYDQWVALVPASGRRPVARYKHAATMVDEKLYISGGNRNGRYLSDLQVFDLITKTWSTIKLNVEDSGLTADDTLLEVFPPICGHSMIKWGRRLLLLGGSSNNSDDNETVWFIDLDSHKSGVVETFRNIPVARRGQSFTLCASKLIMFGGEDRNRRLLNDIYVLDLETMAWTAFETTQTPPSPRFDHLAAMHAERYLFIFGGCSHSVFFNDLHVLDLETMEWSKAEMQGDVVKARASHGGVVVDGNWFIVGGGDNKNGALDMLVINMSKLVASVMLSVKERDPLACEGISISFTTIGGENLLVTFGGYNGNYSNEVLVMRLKPREVLHPKILQSPSAAAAAAAAAGSVTAAYAFAKSELSDWGSREDSNVKVITMDTAQQDLSGEINAVQEAKKTLESSLKEVAAETSVIKFKIEETDSNYPELSKELHSIQGQLAAERSRCAKLETRIEEFQKMLESLPSLEEQVQALRAEKTGFENDLELASSVQKQQSGGIWKWVSG